MRSGRFFSKELLNAVKENSNVRVKTLLGLGADAGFGWWERNAEGDIPEIISAAITSGNSYIFRLILDSAPPAGIDTEKAEDLIAFAADNLKRDMISIIARKYPEISAEKATKTAARVLCNFHGRMRMEYDLENTIKALFDVGAKIDYSDPGVLQAMENMFVCGKYIKKFFKDDIKKNCYSLFEAKKAGAVVSFEIKGKPGDEYGNLFSGLAWLGDTTGLENLIEAGFPVDYKNSEGTTALMAACWNEDGEMIKMLLNRGAGIYVKDNKGSSAIDIMQTCDDDIQKIFIENGNETAKKP